MDNSLSDLIPSYIAGVRPYVPGKPIEEVERELGLTALKLASNENPLGPSPKALEAVQKCLAQSNRYPDAGGFYLREKLAGRHNVGMNNIVLGAGSTELIQLIGHVYFSPGRVGLTSEGTFVMFPMSVRIAGGELVQVPLKNYAFDLAALAGAIDERVRVVYLANPNNPTGTLFSADQFDRFLARVPREVLVVLDEAYCEYLESSDSIGSLAAVRAGRYLISLRTFSKVHGLAGLRIGYGVGHPEVIAALNRVRSPFNVSGLAQAAARAALDDSEHIQRSLASNRRGLALLQRELPGLGIKVVPSAGNFLYCETGNDPREDFKALLAMGVIVRPLGFMGIPQGLRITVGTEKENHRLLDALAKRMAVTGKARRQSASA